MNESAELALAMATLGQIGICSTILIMRCIRIQAYMPLALFFVACAIAVSGPAVRIFFPALQTQHLSLSLPAYLALGPALWLYVKGLISEAQWWMRPRDLWHFALAGAGMIVALLIISLPNDVREVMLIRGELVDRFFPKMLMLLVFLLILGWIVQSGYYLIRVFNHLSRYRQRLRDLFASNEQRELHWLAWLVVIVGGIWLLAMATVVSDNFGGPMLINQQVGSLMGLILIWLLGVWGLRQKPGFEGRYIEPTDGEDLSLQSETQESDKYKRSALGEDQAQRIAAKLEAAMAQNKLHLDPNLSLYKLARALSISPNYISQTLNETIGESFFDYVNRWRVETAKDKIVSSDETILQIALDVGFNARSSFYKAFKRVTGLTPSEFRKAKNQSG